MKKILIFGAAGNIGAYLVDYCVTHLGDKFEIVGVDKKQTSYYEKKGIKYYAFDIVNGDYNTLPKDVYAIVNLVGLLPAYSKVINPIDYIKVNIIGATNILEFAKNTKCDRVLYTQTWSDLAGYWGKEEVLKPTMERKLVFTGDHAFYSITKCTVVDIMKFYKEQYGIKDFVFRLPNVYLYHPNSSYFVDGIEKKVAYRYMIERASDGQDIEMWGNPNAFKDILYVKDLCQLLCKAMVADIDGGIYNAGTGVRTTLKEQIQGIVDVFSPIDKKSKIIKCPDKASFTSFVMDISNARDELGYNPKFFYKDYLIDYKKEKKLKRFDELWETK